MLTLNLRDFNLSSYSASEIIIVGHYVYIDDTCDEENFTRLHQTPRYSYLGQS